MHCSDAHVTLLPVRQQRSICAYLEVKSSASVSVENIDTTHLCNCLKEVLHEYLVPTAINVMVSMQDLVLRVTERLRICTY